MARYARLHGPWIFYINNPYFHNLNSTQKISWIKKWGASAVISRKFIGFHKLKNLNIPVVAVEVLKKNINWAIKVETDPDEISKLGYEYFIKNGYKNFGFCGYSDLPWSKDRQQSFSKLVKKGGYKFSLFNSKSPLYMNWDKDYPALVEWLKLIDKPAGILCCSDYRAFDVIEACITAEVRVPFELSVLGVGNDKGLCTLSNPPFSSIALNTEKVGFLTAELIDNLLSGGKILKNRLIVKPTHIEERQSTNTMAITDTEVLEALKFIKSSSNRIIDVNSVLDKVHSSYSSLNNKFEKIIGNSIYEEIKRTRIERICKMLLETNYSISQIAYSLGYDKADHISRFFKKNKGVTPSEYRKQNKTYT